MREPLTSSTQLPTQVSSLPKQPKRKVGGNHLHHLPTHPLRQVAYPGSKRGKQERPLNITYPLTHLGRQLIQVAKGESRRDHLTSPTHFPTYIGTYNQAKKVGSERGLNRLWFFELLETSRLVPLIPKTPKTTCGFHERTSKELWVCSFIILNFLIIFYLII